MEYKDFSVGTRVTITEENGYIKVGTKCEVIRRDTDSGNSHKVRALESTGSSFWLYDGKFELSTLKDNLVDGQHVIYRNGMDRIYDAEKAEFQYTDGVRSMDLESYDGNLKRKSGIRKASWDIVEVYTPEKVTKIPKVVHYKETKQVTQAEVNAKFGETVEVIA
jgi:hypothetical protein